MGPPLKFLCRFEPGFSPGLAIWRSVNQCHGEIGFTNLGRES